MNQTTKLSTKGQIVLPKALRTDHRWKVGTEFLVEEREGGILLMPKAPAAAKTWESLVGCVRYVGPRKSLKELEKAVAALARAQK